METWNKVLHSDIGLVNFYKVRKIVNFEYIVLLAKFKIIYLFLKLFRSNLMKILFFN